MSKRRRRKTNRRQVRTQQKSMNMLQGTTLADVLQEEGTPLGRNHRPSHPYSQVAPVYTCVRIKSDATAMMQPRVSTADDQVLETGDAVALLAQPNPKQTGAMFWRETSAYLDLFGRAYWYKIIAGKRVLEMHVINPLQMEPEFDANGELYRWRYMPKTTISTQWEYLEPEFVHEVYEHDHERLDRPGDGLGCVRVAAQACAQFFKSDLANEASLDNGVEPGGAFVTQDELSDPVRRDFKSQIAEKHQGVTNRRRYMLLEGGLDFKTMQANFKEMEFYNLKMSSREDICAVIGVPVLVANYSSGQSSLGSGKEFETAERVFWFNTMIPRANWLADEWDSFVTADIQQDRSLSQKAIKTCTLKRKQLVCPTYIHAHRKVVGTNQKLFTWFDTSGIAAVQRAGLELASQAGEWFDRGVPLNDLIRTYNLPFEERPWGDTWWKPIGTDDVQAPATLANEPDGSFPTDPQPEDKPTPQEEPSNDPPPEDSQEQQAKELIRKATSPDQRRKLWNSWRRSWMGIEQQAKGKISRHFMELRAEVLKNLDNHKGKKEFVAELMFDLVKANQSLVVKMRPIITKSIQLGGEQIMDEHAAASKLTEPPVFNLDAPEVVAAVRKRTVTITSVNKTMQDRLRKALAAGVADGQSANEIAQVIKKQFNIASHSQARTIAYTEIGGAVEQARQLGREQVGIPFKSWLWSQAEKGRKHHAQTETETNAKPVATDAYFTIAVTGVKTKYPRGSGKASEDVNCGCSSLSRYDDPAKDMRQLVHLHTKGFYTDTKLRKKNMAKGINHAA